jgi:hypothetical protein
MQRQDVPGRRPGAPNDLSLLATTLCRGMLPWGGEPKGEALLLTASRKDAKNAKNEQADPEPDFHPFCRVACHTGEVGRECGREPRAAQATVEWKVSDGR